LVITLALLLVLFLARMLPESLTLPTFRYSFHRWPFHLSPLLHYNP